MIEYVCNLCGKPTKEVDKFVRYTVPVFRLKTNVLFDLCEVCSEKIIDKITPQFKIPPELEDMDDLDELEDSEYGS
jgi:hypothetical protein